MVELANEVVVVVLARAPGAGGKSRLFGALQTEPDPALLSALLLDTLAGTEVAGVRRAVAFTPATAEAELAALLPPDVLRIPQVDGELGARMQGVFDALLTAGAAGVVLIGADIPTLPPASIAAARDVLLQQDGVVIGPALDGGYYLIGARETPVALLSVGGWGAPDVLDRTLDRARTEEIDVTLLTPCPDVDHPDDLWVVMGEHERAPRTAAWARAYITRHRERVLRPAPGPLDDEISLR